MTEPTILEQICSVTKWIGGVTAAGIAVPLLYQATRSVYDDVYERWLKRQQDQATLDHIRTQNRLRDIREIHPDERGRYPLLYGENGILRDPNNLRAFTLTVIREAYPQLDQLDGIIRAITAAGGWPAAATAGKLLPEAGPAPVQWPTAISLVDLFRGKKPSIYDLVIGVRPGEKGDVDVISDSIHNLMHVLEVGASGWGKSSWLRSFLWQIAKARDPIEVVAVDTNGSEFNVLRGWGKLRYPVARSTGDAIAVLDQVRAEIDRRKGLYEQHPLVTKLTEYNEATGADLPPWVVTIDEGTHLLNQKGIGEPLRTAVQTARQYGIYVLLAGQSAKHSVVDTQIRDQFSTRLCFRTSPTSSRVILDDRAASDLHDKGRAWVQMAGREMVELLGPWIARADFLAALSNGGPRCEMPTTLSGSRDGVDLDDVDDPSLPDDDRIRHLYRAGVSKRQIALRVCGYAGGAAFAKVNKALDSSTEGDTAVQDEEEERIAGQGTTTGGKPDPRPSPVGVA
jgi:hypothetical protein